jgi:uncharacterized protein (DUF1697 family)
MPGPSMSPSAAAVEIGRENPFVPTGAPDPMAWVVFLRAVNVGGRPFKSRPLAEALREYGLVHLGAAGTFVAHTNASDDELRSEIRRLLPFETEILVCPGDEILGLLEEERFPGVPSEASRCLTILTTPEPRAVALPLAVPDPQRWEATALAARGRYVFTAYRRLNDRLVYPNALVEKAFGVGATTRNWATVEKIGELLGRPSAAPATAPRVTAGSTGRDSTIRRRSPRAPPLRGRRDRSPAAGRRGARRTSARDSR